MYSLAFQLLDSTLQQQLAVLAIMTLLLSNLLPNLIPNFSYGVAMLSDSKAYDTCVL